MIGGRNCIIRGRGVNLMIATGKSFCGKCYCQWPHMDSDTPGTCLLCGNKERYVWIYKESDIILGSATLSYSETVLGADIRVTIRLQT